MIHFSRLASRLNYTFTKTLSYFLSKTRKGLDGNISSPPTIFFRKIRLQPAHRPMPSLAHSSRPLVRLLKFNFSTNNPEESFSNTYAISSMEALNLFMEAQREYYGHDNPQRAQELFQKAMYLQPHNIEFMFQISRFFNSQGQIPKYIDILHRMLKLAATEDQTLDIKRMLWCAYIISRNEKQSQLIESEFNTPEHTAFFNAQRQSLTRMALDPLFFKYTLLRRKAEIFLHHDYDRTAMKYLREVVDHIDEVQPQNKIYLVKCAENLFKLAENKGDSKTVVFCVQKLLQTYRDQGISSDDALYIMLEGIVAQHSGRCNQAIKKYQKCQELGFEPEVEILKRKIETYVLFDDHENVLEQGKIFLEKYGDDHEHSYHFYRRLIDSCRALKRFQEALVYAERIQDNMHNIEYYFMKYDIHKEAKDLDKAIECLGIILDNSEEPEYCRRALNFRARCYQELGKLEHAVSDLTKLMKSHKDDKGEDQVWFELHKRRGEQYFNLHKHKEALRDFVKTLEFGEDQEALYGQARCLQELGGNEKAREIYLLLKKRIDDKATTLREEVQTDILKWLSK